MQLGLHLYFIYLIQVIKNIQYQLIQKYVHQSLINVHFLKRKFNSYTLNAVRHIDLNFSTTCARLSQ